MTHIFFIVSWAQTETYFILSFSSFELEQLCPSQITLIPAAIICVAKKMEIKGKSSSMLHWKLWVDFQL